MYNRYLINSVFFFLECVYWINYGHFWRCCRVVPNNDPSLPNFTGKHGTIDSFPIEGKETKYVLYLKETPECPANLDIISAFLELQLQYYLNTK